MNYILAFVACILLYACSNNTTNKATSMNSAPAQEQPTSASVHKTNYPGSGIKGFMGIPWEANVKTVAKAFNVKPHTTKTETLFLDSFSKNGMRLGSLLENGFAMYLGDKNDPTYTLGKPKAFGYMEKLEIKRGEYAVFIDNKVCMYVRELNARNYDTYKKSMQEKYGPIRTEVKTNQGQLPTVDLKSWDSNDGKAILGRVEYSISASQGTMYVLAIHLSDIVYSTLIEEINSIKAKA